jgi:phosphatidylserine/phosphatidylglycerophosphate/cardiolipin synthase-like enzyme
MNPHAELLQRIVTASAGLDSAILDQFCGQLEALAAVPGNEHMNSLTGGVAQPEARAVLMGLVSTWLTHAPNVTPCELALAIRAANSTDAFHRARQSLEIVWSGPAPKATSFRRTDQALLELIQQAKNTLIIVTFAAYKVPQIATALVVAAARGVKVTLILESMEESDGKVTISAINGLGEELAEAAAVYVWPLENRGKDSQGKHGSLHVKCAVADANTALISSANLTEYAMNLNMEMGLLVRGGDVPGDLDHHLRTLIQSGVLAPAKVRNQEA